jgi:hypothetical protein
MYSGDISFPIYLTHFIGLREYPRFWQSFSPKQGVILYDHLFLGFFFTIVVSDLTHRFVEQPCMKAGNWLIRYLRANVFVPKKKPETKEKEEDEMPTPNLRRFSQLPEEKGESFATLIKKRKEALENGENATNFDMAGVPNRDRLSIISNQRLSRMFDSMNGSSNGDHYEPPMVTVHEYSQEESSPFVPTHDVNLEKKPSILKKGSALAGSPAERHVAFNPTGSGANADGADQALDINDAFEAVGSQESADKGKRPMSLAEYVQTKRSSQSLNSSLIDGIIKPVNQPFQ